MLTALEHLKQCTSIRCLTRDLPPGGKAIADEWVKVFKSQYPQTEVKYLGGGALHDRYVVTDENLLLVGHGLKDFGTRESFVLLLDKELVADTITSVQAAFDARWTSAQTLG